MLEFYFRITRRLYPWRAIFWALTVASVVAFGATVLTSAGGDDSPALVPAVAVLLWSLSLLLIVYTFIHPLPASDAGDRWFARLCKRLARFAYWLLAWTMTGSCLFALYVTLKAVMIVARA